MYTEKDFAMKVLNMVKRAKTEDKPGEFILEQASKLYREMNPHDTEDMTPEQRRTYNSVFNLYADQICNNGMGLINVDLCAYSRTKRKIRLIEYKHNNERISNGHEEILRVFAEIFKESNKYDGEVVVLQSNKPFDKGEIKFIGPTPKDDKFRTITDVGVTNRFLKMNDNMDYKK